MTESTYAGDTPPIAADDQATQQTVDPTATEQTATDGTQNATGGWQDADPSTIPYSTDTVVDPGTGWSPEDRRIHEAQQTGGVVETQDANTYDGRTQAEILGESQQGLIDMASRDNPLMELERAKGKRLAESKGLGNSSFAGRAAEGAALDKAWPLVQQAQQIASQERLAAQSLTANDSIQYANRRLQSQLQEQSLAVQSGDAARARQLQEDMNRDKNIMDEYVRRRELAVQSGNQAEQRRLDEMMTRYQIDGRLLEQERQLDMQISENDLNRKFDEMQQDKDIDYKKWLSAATFGYETLLRSNQQAVDMYGRFTDQAMMILNNHDSTSAQKSAAMDALREGLTGSLMLLEGISGLDLGNYLPDGFNPADYGQPPPGIDPMTGLRYSAEEWRRILQQEGGLGSGMTDIEWEEYLSNNPGAVRGS